MTAISSVPTTSYMEKLEKVVNEVVAPAAMDIDQSGAYPRAAMQALGEAGLLGLISAEDVGGMGLGHRAAALAVERVAQVCGS
ncbi:MAG: acyl-CoA dehydrogenase family protein, partial [Chloroflexia bacterium]